MSTHLLPRAIATVIGAAICAQGAHAHAGVRGMVRLGVVPLDLESDADTPLFGDDVQDAVTAYNVAADAYDRMAGTNTAHIDAGDLGVSDTLVTIAPGLEVVDGHYFLRLEGIAGYGSVMRSYGVGFYPLNLQLGLGKDVAVYGSLGGTASYLTRKGSGDDGALVSARAAAGLRFANRIVVELGYSAFVLGGVIDQSELAAMASAYDRRMPPPTPKGIVAAGEGRGLVDVSLGVSF